MELLLVRHARPHLVPHDTDGADPGLTDEGRAQAAAVAVP
jgi:broad specificity phosphatase PhoE